MPCYDPPLTKAERIKYGYFNEEDLSQMLCLLMREGAEALLTVAMPPEDLEIANRIKDWWVNHQKLDQSRKRN